MKAYKKVIPKGVYCYEGSRNPASKTYRPCVFWSINQKKAQRYGTYQAAGYCGFLKVGDWMKKSSGMLFDQIKECGVNIEIEDEFLQDEADREAAESEAEAQEMAYYERKAKRRAR